MNDPVAIPEQLTVGFRVLARMDSAEFELVQEALSSKAFSAAELVSAISSNVRSAQGSAKQIVQALVGGLAFERASGSGPHAAAHLIAGSDAFSPEEQAQLGPRLAQIFQADTSLQIVASATDLLMDANNVYLGSRIITDLRPVHPQTNADRIEPAVAAFIMHSLRLDYRNSGRSESIYMVLNDAELREVRSVIDRALDKSRHGADIIQRAGLKNVHLFDHDPESEPE